VIILLIAFPLLMLAGVLAALMIMYKAGYRDGQTDARARHALARLDAAARARAVPA
jgi:hypothetical protein